MIHNMAVFSPLSALVHLLKVVFFPNSLERGLQEVLLLLYCKWVIGKNNNELCGSQLVRIHKKHHCAACKETAAGKD